MINNPFVLIGDIPAPYFCDRQQEIARLVKGIHGGENICLVSERRMGKSRFLSLICNPFYKQYIIHYAS